MPARRLRLCYTLNTFDLGGAETVALDLARHHDPSAFAVEVVALIEPTRAAESDMHRRFREAGVRTHAIIQPTYRSPQALWRIYSYLRRGHFDVIHGHNRGADYWGSRLGRLAGVRHTSWTRHLVYQDMPPKQAARYQGLVAGGSRVIAVSQTVRQACENREGLDAQGLETIVNGVDLARFRLMPPDERASVRGRLGLTGEDRMLLFVGRFSDQKAPEAFVSLVTRLRQGDARVRGFMCGYGPLQATVEGLAKASGGGVTVLGLRDDVPDLLAACDLFVSTSRNEGLPLNVMEAMACGAAFVAPAIPQIAELTGQRAGLDQQLMSPPPLTGEVPEAILAEWTVTAAAVLADSERRGRVGACGRQVMVEEFSVERMTRRYEDFFRRLCGIG